MYKSHTNIDCGLSRDDLWWQRRQFCNIQSGQILHSQLFVFNQRCNRCFHSKLMTDFSYALALSILFLLSWPCLAFNMIKRWWPIYLFIEPLQCVRKPEASWSTLIYGQIFDLLTSWACLHFYFISKLSSLGERWRKLLFKVDFTLSNFVGAGTSRHLLACLESHPCVQTPLDVKLPFANFVNTKIHYRVCCVTTTAVNHIVKRVKDVDKNHVSSPSCCTPHLGRGSGTF